MAAGRAPITGTNVPSSDSSPKAQAHSAASFGMISSAANSESAMGRSKWLPSFGMSAGLRLMVMRLEGRAIAMALSAVRTLSRASLTALSGRPTMEKAGMPGVTAHCTSTDFASTPSKATV